MVGQVETFQQPQPAQIQAESHPKAMNLAASWYVAMGSKELKKKPKAIELFSQPLVAWRDQQGHPVIMERFCAHMGASLAVGKLKDGCIQCPFHHWRFDSTGECVSIPEIDKIPPTAHQKTYITKEKYGFIWVWYGSETPLFPLPEFPPAESEQKNYMLFPVTFYLETTVRQVLENAYDVCHFTALHSFKPTVPIKITLLDEQNLEQRLESPIDKEAFCSNEIKIQFSRYLGPLGWFIRTLRFNNKSESLLLNVQQDIWPSGAISRTLIDSQEKVKSLVVLTPIAENKVILHLIFSVRKTGNLILDLVNYLNFGLYSMFVTQQDVPIWNTLNPDGGGAYVQTDYEVLKFREFYQSWVNRVE